MVLRAYLGFFDRSPNVARADTHIGQGDADHGRADPPQKVSGSSCLVKSCCEALPHDQNDIDEGCQRLGVVETQKRRCLDENHLRQVSGCFQYRRRPQCQLPAVRDEWNQWDRRDVGQRRRPQGCLKDFWGNRCRRVLARRADAIAGVKIVGAHHKHPLPAVGKGGRKISDHQWAGRFGAR